MDKLTFDKFLDEDEYDSLIQEVTSEPLNRNKLLIQLALETGARASELLAVTKRDLVMRKKGGSVKIYGLKGSSDREVPLSKKLFSQLKGLDGNNLFDITYHRLYQIWENFAPRKAGGKKIKTFHCLRHTCAIRLYRETKDVKIVQTILGHRDLRNTMIYVDFVYSQDELRKALKR